MRRSFQSSSRPYYGYSEGNVYCNNGGDDEEDDDDLVLYKERKNSQTDGLMSQTQSQSPLKSPQRPLIPKVSHTMSRQERRRRRQEWKERTMMENAGYGYSDDDVSDSEEEGLGTQEDAFASLKSILDQRQEVEDEQDDSDSASEESEEDVKQRADLQHATTASREDEMEQVDKKKQSEEVRDVDNENGQPRDIGTWQMIPNKASNTQNGQDHQVDENVQAQNKSTSEEPIQPSPPDFLFFDDGQDERDMEDEQSNDTRIRHKIPSTISVLDSPASHSRKRSRSSSKKRDNGAKFESKRNAIGKEKRPKSRRHSTDEGERSHHRSRNDRRSSSTGRNETRVRSKPRSGRPEKSRSSSSGKLRQNSGRVSLSPTSKSVVGTRPVHWGGTRNMASRGKQGQNEALPAPMERLTTAAALAAATREPPRSQRIIPPPNMKVRPTISQRPDAAGAPAFSTFGKTSPRHKSNETSKSTAPVPGNSDRGSNINRASQSVISFAPSFLPKANFGVKNNRDQVEDFKDPKGRVRHRALRDQGIFSPTDKQNSSQLVSSSHRSKQRRAPAGRWAKRLSSLRNNTKCDAIRLFHSSDTLAAWNNPRNKATTHTDLTIIGDPNKVTSLSSGTAATTTENQKFTILCIIHNHVQKNANNNKFSSTSYASRAKNDMNGLAHASIVQQTEPFYSWVTFERTTANSISLQVGQQLRIYDGQLIPCRVDTVIDIPIKNLNNVIGGECHPYGNNNISKSCRHMLICTALCEVYSSDWPALATTMATTTTGDARDIDDDAPLVASLAAQPCDEEPTTTALHQLV